MSNTIRWTWISALVLFLSAAVLHPIAQAAEDDGFRPIFDGKSLEGWDGDPKLWRVEKGLIVGETAADNPLKANSFLIWRGGEPADFELKAEFNMPNPGFANSGIQYRSWEGPGKWQVSGYQADMDGENKYTGICYGENFRGFLAQRGHRVVVEPNHKPKTLDIADDPEELAKAIKKNDWNEYHIIVRGKWIQHLINGRLMCEVFDEDTLARKEGLIALQLHQGPPMKVQFRNIRLKELKPKPPVGE